MIYTVIETRENGSLGFIRWRNGSPRITTKGLAERIEKKAVEEGKNVEIREWEKLSDAQDFVSAHNKEAYESYFEAKRSPL